MHSSVQSRLMKIKHRCEPNRKEEQGIRRSKPWFPTPQLTDAVRSVSRTCVGLNKDIRSVRAGHMCMNEKAGQRPTSEKFTLVVRKCNNNNNIMHSASNVDRMRARPTSTPPMALARWGAWEETISCGGDRALEGFPVQMPRRYYFPETG